MSLQSHESYSITCVALPSIAYSNAQKELHQHERLSRRYNNGRKDLSWLSLSRYVQQLVPCRATIAPLIAQ